MHHRNVFLSTLALAVAFSLFGGAALADHGSMGFGLGTASPLITDTAVTLPEGKFAVGTRIQYINFKRFSDSFITSLNDRFHEAEEEGDLSQGKRHVHSTDELINPAFVGAYGVTDDLTVGLRFPYVMRTNVRATPHAEDHHDISTHDFGDINGIGDVTVWGEYRFFNTADNLTNVAALFAVKTPTGRVDRVGRKDEHGERELLDTHLQPGSGSWDGSLGLAFTQAFDAFAFDTSVLYTWATKGAQNTDMGDSFFYNFALSWSPGPAQAAGLQASSNINPWTFVLEFNGEWRDKQTRHSWRDQSFPGAWRDPDSGGHVLYFSPGVRYAGGPNWNIGLSFGAPIIADVNSYQVEPDYRIINRINFTF